MERFSRVWKNNQEGSVKLRNDKRGTEGSGAIHQKKVTGEPDDV